MNLGRYLGVLVAAIVSMAAGTALCQVSPLPANEVMASPSGTTGYLAPRPLVSSDLFQGGSCPAGNLFYNNSGSIGCLTPGAGGTGTVTSLSWTGGLVSIATPTTTPAFTIAGTSGGIPYFSSGSTWASSAALAANQIVLGGGAGAAPSTPVGLGTTTKVLHGNASGAPTFGAITSADIATVLASPPPIGATAANTGAFTALSVNPASGLNQGYLSTQTFTGTAGGGFVGNNIIISSDNIAASGQAVLGVSINHTFGGSATQGARVALAVFMAQTAATNSVNPGNGRSYIASESSIYTTSGDGGTSGSPLGTYFASNTNAQGQNGGVNLVEVTTEEADFGLLTGSSSELLFGKALVHNGNVHATLASLEEAYLVMYNAGTIALNNGIMFGLSINSGAYPVSTTGSLINSLVGTVAYGVNFLNVTCSTKCWASPGASVDGVGNGVLKQLNLSASMPLLWGTNTGTNGGQVLIDQTSTNMFFDDLAGGAWVFRTTGGTTEAQISATGVYSSGANAGVTCSAGFSASTGRSIGGIVTHC